MGVNRGILFLAISALLSGCGGTHMIGNVAARSASAAPSKSLHTLSVSTTNLTVDGFIQCPSAGQTFCWYGIDYNDADCTINLSTDACGPAAGPPTTGTASNRYRTYVECVDQYTDNKLNATQVVAGSTAARAVQSGVAMVSSYANEDEIDGTTFLTEYLTDPATATTWFQSYTGGVYPSEVNGMIGDIIAAGSSYGAATCH